MDIQPLLEKSSREHSHLCPRQILGVRIGLRGMEALQLEANQNSKRLLVITETDGCFADGLSAATNCTVGHRTLRVEDYGKIAATFVDTQTGRAIRVAPVTDIRQRAYAYAPDEPRHYFAQMQAYRTMPDEEMLTVQEVFLNTSVERIISRPVIRVNCDMCGEEIINEREIIHEQSVLCRACAGGGYYQSALCRDDEKRQLLSCEDIQCNHILPI
ncbi:MAG: formylmethanofuran dehydrogenase [Chloroflexi bacterium]|nr:formylmethanofuran dehydrogenase [Chloroflexota bacterium]NOG74955.1 formylmethanofuran dehydrogenase [Chloroflexota bacterium]